jgi:hypothetical protein
LDSEQFHDSFPTGGQNRVSGLWVPLDDVPDADGLLEDELVGLDVEYFQVVLPKEERG